MKCVDKRELEQFLQGDIEPERLVALDEHLSACAACRALLDALPARARAVASFGADLIGASDCPDYEQLSALVDETLDEAKSRSLTAHVNMCELCAGDVDRMRALRSQGVLRDTVRVQPGTARRSAVWPRGLWRRALAGVLVAGAVAIAAVTLRQPPSAPVTKPVVTAVAPAHEPAHVRPGPAVKPTAPKPSLVAAIPDKEKPAQPRPNALLRDGRYQLVKADGRYAMARIDGKSIRTPLEARVAALIAEKIRTGKIKPAEPVRVAMNDIRLRDDGGYTLPPTAPKQISPVGVVVMSDHPTFKWSKVDLAESYRLVVTDKNGNPVFEGATDRTTLKLGQPLERGRVYFWRVGARFSKNDSWANSRAAGLRLISAEDMAAIRAVERRMPGSHLALAAVYESVGLYADAADEYRAVRRANPGSRLARRIAAP
jgi:hypothetical protein